MRKTATVMRLIEPIVLSTKSLKTVTTYNTKSNEKLLQLHLDG